MSGAIRVGVGGWSFEPWRGVFYPAGLPQKRELEFASRALTSIEINGTYYSTFKPDSWRKWREETPDGFVFAVKASRFCTNRKILAEGGESVDAFEMPQPIPPYLLAFAVGDLSPRQLFQPIHGDLYAVRMTSWMASTSRSNCLDSRSSCFRPSGVSL